MGEANKDVVARNNHFNFLKRFTSQNSEFSDLEQLDLNLGLSLGGYYSQIPEKKPLIRTSSLNGGDLPEGGGFLSLARSSSLPTEAEQELRKLKEMQAMKRVEAKRRLLEKQRQSKGGGSEEVNSPAEAKSPNWTINSVVKNTAFCRPSENLRSNVSPSTPSANLVIQGTENSWAMENGKTVNPANYSSGSAITSEIMPNGKPVNPANSHHADSVISFGKRENGKPVEPSESEQERPSKKVKVLADSTRDISMIEIMKLMPSVTTTGDGPNGRKIEGFLYRYTKGQVSIVCVCHGNFLSPAEFVKHAGGSNVTNPMKHINVLPATL